MSRTLAGLLRELNIRIVPISRSYCRGSRETCAGRTLARIFEMRGYDHLRSVLQTFTETSASNKRALTAPAFWAISDVLLARPCWFGSVWFEVMDSVDIGEMFELAARNRRIGQPRQQIATLIYEKMRHHFPAQARAGARRRRQVEEEEKQEMIAA